MGPQGSQCQTKLQSGAATYVVLGQALIIMSSLNLFFLAFHIATIDDQFGITATYFLEFLPVYEMGSRASRPQEDLQVNVIPLARRDHYDLPLTIKSTYYIRFVTMS
jgi:hypothetical protein